LSGFWVLWSFLKQRKKTEGNLIVAKKRKKKKKKKKKKITDLKEKFVFCFVF
jgi:hypothetical protein